MIRTLSHDPALQKVVRFHALADGTFAVETLYDTQDMVDLATRIRNDEPKSKGDWHLGVVPMPMLQEFRQGGRLHDPKAVVQWFNEREKLRTRKAKL